MTYKQNIRKVSKRLEYAHYELMLKGVIIDRTRAQAKEAIDMQAASIREALSTFGLTGEQAINKYLFSQGLLMIL